MITQNIKDMDDIEEEFSNMVNFNLPCKNVMLNLVQEKKQILVNFASIGLDGEAEQARKMVLGYWELEEVKKFINCFVNVKKERVRGFFGERNKG